MAGSWAWERQLYLSICQYWCVAFFHPTALGYILFWNPHWAPLLKTFVKSPLGGSGHSALVTVLPGNLSSGTPDSPVPNLSFAPERQC